MKRPSRLAALVRWLLAAAACLFAYVAYVYLTLPDVRPLISENPSSTAFMDIRAAEARRAGQELRRDFRWVPYDRISPELRRAVIIAEDAAFWQHEGVDYVELRISLERNWQERSFVRGASTITQQLAKNLYLSESRNPVRKLRELIVARRLEAALSKTRIFEIYLNVIEWGDGIYGIEAAARNYFGKPAANLTRSEAALLAGAIINPRLLRPDQPTPRLRARQRLILERMAATSRRTEAAVRTATAPAHRPVEPVRTAVEPARSAVEPDNRDTSQVAATAQLDTSWSVE